MPSHLVDALTLSIQHANRNAEDLFREIVTPPGTRRVDGHGAWYGRGDAEKARVLSRYAVKLLLEERCFCRFCECRGFAWEME